MHEFRTYAGLLIALGSTFFGFLAFVLIGHRVGGIEAGPLATICGAAAGFTGAAVALRAFQLNRRTAQEPWTVVFRELHKEFWNDPVLANVRTWLCSDQAYNEELLPVLLQRQSGPVSKEAHATLEALDKYCALMIRVSSLPTTQMTEEQLRSYKSLGYHLWLQKTARRSEVRDYIRMHWIYLSPLMPEVSA